LCGCGAGNFLVGDSMVLAQKIMWDSTQKSLVPILPQLQQDMQDINNASIL